MEPVKVIAGAVSVLDRDDVDTDQIIPKQFLKRVERTGFGEFLFYDWAHEDGWDLPTNPILVTGQNFGCGSSREHAPWALEDYGFRAIIAAELRRHLPQQLHQERPAAGGAARGGVRALMQAGEAEVDLEALEVRFDGRAVPSRSTPRRAGGCSTASTTSRIALQQDDEIAAYEAEREGRQRRGPNADDLMGLTMGKGPLGPERAGRSTSHSSRRNRCSTSTRIPPRPRDPRRGDRRRLARGAAAARGRPPAGVLVPTRRPARGPRRRASGRTEPSPARAS